MKTSEAHQIARKELKIKIVRAIFQLIIFAIGTIGIFVLEDITFKLLCLYLIITSTDVLSEELSK